MVMNIALLAILFVAVVPTGKAQWPGRNVSEAKTDSGSDRRDAMKWLAEVGYDVRSLNINVLVERVIGAMREIQDLNSKPGNTFVTALYPFAAWSAKQIQQLFGLIPSRVNASSLSLATQSNSAYSYVNYTDRGQVTPVKDQRHCGSCYSFAAVGGIESSMIINGLATQSIDLSEQQIVDCTLGKYWGNFNFGCDGGSILYAIDHFNKVKPLTENAYRYRSNVGTCPANQRGAATKLYYQEVQVSEDQLAYILSRNGPVPLALSADSPAFMFYKSGVINDVSGCNRQVNHAVLLTGIVKEKDGSESWIIKNSWGPSWGENGYARIRKGQNICNLVKFPVTPVSTKPLVLA